MIVTKQPTDAPVTVTFSEKRTKMTPQTSTHIHDLSAIIFGCCRGNLLVTNTKQENFRPGWSKLS